MLIGRLALVLPVLLADLSDMACRPTLLSLVPVFPPSFSTDTRLDLFPLRLLLALSSHLFDLSAFPLWRGSPPFFFQRITDFIQDSPPLINPIPLSSVFMWILSIQTRLVP